jgi:hypothetical protein
MLRHINVSQRAPGEDVIEAKEFVRFMVSKVLCVMGCIGTMIYFKHGSNYCFLLMTPGWTLELKGASSVNTGSSSGSTMQVTVSITDAQNVQGEMS